MYILTQVHTHSGKTVPSSDLLYAPRAHHQCRSSSPIRARAHQSAPRKLPHIHDAHMARLNMSAASPCCAQLLPLQAAHFLVVCGASFKQFSCDDCAVQQHHAHAPPSPLLGRRMPGKRILCAGIEARGEQMLWLVPCLLSGDVAQYCSRELHARGHCRKLPGIARHKLRRSELPEPDWPAHEP